MIISYRSDVKILCGEKAFEMLNESFKKNDFYPDEILKSDNNEYLISFYSERWYDHFFHISDINEIFEKLDEFDSVDNNEGYEYKYIRVGEECGDYDEQYNEISFNLLNDICLDTQISYSEKNFNTKIKTIKENK